MTHFPFSFSIFPTILLVIYMSLRWLDVISIKSDCIASEALIVG